MPGYSKETHLVDYYHQRLERSQSWLERMAILALIELCHW